MSSLATSVFEHDMSPQPVIYRKLCWLVSGFWESFINEFIGSQRPLFFGGFFVKEDKPLDIVTKREEIIFKNSTSRTLLTK